MRHICVQIKKFCDRAGLSDLMNTLTSQPSSGSPEMRIVPPNCSAFSRMLLSP